MFSPSKWCNTWLILPDLDPLGPHINHVVINLGECATTISNLVKQVDSIVVASFCQLQLLTKVKPFLSHGDLKKAIHAFISTWFNYCNNLHLGINKRLLNRLQFVQNSADKLLKQDNIKPSQVFSCIQFGANFKLVSFLFSATNGLALFVLYYILSSMALHSAGQYLLEVHRRGHKHGAKSFAVAGLKLWIALLLQLRGLIGLPQFK